MQKIEIDSCLEDMPNEILYKINTYLSSLEIGRSAQLNQKFYNFFQPEVILQKLLRHVVRGEQMQAEKIARTSPLLALKKSKIKDYSERQFLHTSPLQYAAWALDSFMLQMLLHYLPINEHETALNQLNDLDQNGIYYLFENKLYCEAHYNFFTLINIIYTYINNVHHWLPEQQRNYWRYQVGAEQRKAPAHVAQAYCHSKSFGLTLSKFSRDLIVDAYFQDYLFQFHWYTRQAFPAFGWVGLGVDLAIARGNEVNAIASSDPGLIELVTTDWLSLSHLKTIRTSEIRGLKQTLLQSILCGDNFYLTL